MQLKSMTFTPADGEGEVYPETVTVTMTIREALFIAKWSGGLNGPAMDEVVSGASQWGHGIYACLVGDVFNRCWDDGGKEAVRTL